MLARWGWKGDRPLLMVHPGSGGMSKRWPLDRFFSLTRTFVETEGAFVVIFTGPAEDDLFLDRVERFCRGEEGTAHAGDADLTALAALLGLCGAYVGNDSGVSHLAAATGAPTIALFGATDQLVWGPVGRKVKVIAAGSLDAIPVEQVAEAVKAFLSGQEDAG
jgi:ADP-heptose:LPS heptosyltransferase